MAAPLPELRKLELLPLQLPDCGIVVKGSASMLRSELDVLGFLSDEECSPIFGGESLPSISTFEELFFFGKLLEVRFPADLFRSTFWFFAGCFSAEQNPSIPQKLLGKFSLDSVAPITLQFSCIVICFYEIIEFLSRRNKNLFGNFLLQFCTAIKIS
jgi:hypothetical protein